MLSQQAGQGIIALVREVKFKAAVVVNFLGRGFD